MPPARYALSGSRLRLSNGSTARLLAGISAAGLEAVVDETLATVGDFERKNWNASRPEAMIPATIVRPTIFLPVCFLLDPRDLISDSRLIPSGVISKAHDRISATGKPKISSKTTSRIAQFGISKNGKTWVAIWISNHETIAYATATLQTLRRFSSAKKSFIPTKPYDADLL